MGGQTPIEVKDQNSDIRNKGDGYIVFFFEKK